uniref:BESS domain-containing protein n=1 Tax=Strongyloides venezuelensis TaxID=75913 RepID=A0A0K0FSD1_STRVS
MTKLDKFWKSFEDNLDDLKSGSEITIKVLADPTLDDGSILYSVATKKEVMKRNAAKKKSEKKRHEARMKKVNCIETSEGYSTFMKTEPETCNCRDTFQKEFPFGMKELQAMVHNMKYLKTIVNNAKELTKMLESQCE